MKKLTTIFLLCFSGSMFSQYSSGYVLIMSDSTIRVPENSISFSKVNGLQATFNNKTNSYYAADAGSNDSYVITLSNPPAAYFTGMYVIFKANTVNTGAASLNVNGLGVKTIVKRVSTTLANADIPSQRLCVVIYDGTNFILQNPIVN